MERFRQLVRGSLFFFGAKCGTVILQQVDLFVQIGCADTPRRGCVALHHSRESATKACPERPSRGDKNLEGFFTVKMRKIAFARNNIKEKKTIAYNG